MSGYNVIEAFDGQDAVDKFTESKGVIALAIIDVVMPRKNGQEVYHELRNIGPDTRIIFMSGYAGDVLAEKGICDDTVDFIKKPVSPDELLLRVRAVLDKQV